MSCWWESRVNVVCELCVPLACKKLMHLLFHNILVLLPCFIPSLVSVVLFYDGFIMIDMIGAYYKNTIYFSQVSTKYERFCAKLSLFSLIQLISFSHSC